MEQLVDMDLEDIFEKEEQVHFLFFFEIIEIYTMLLRFYMVNTVQRHEKAKISKNKNRVCRKNTIPIGRAARTLFATTISTV